MKNLIGILGLLGAGLGVCCSSETNNFDSSGSGGTMSAGGSTGSGGTTVNPTEVPVKEWGSIAGAAGGTSDIDDGPFGDLFANTYYDPNDPCSQAIPWITGVNTQIVNGNLVQYQGKVYKYDNSTSSCNKELTNMFDQCIPSAPAEWCRPCWVLQDTTCPVSASMGGGGAGGGGAGGGGAGGGGANGA